MKTVTYQMKIKLNEKVNTMHEITVRYDFSVKILLECLEH